MKRGRGRTPSLVQSSMRNKKQPVRRVKVSYQRYFACLAQICEKDFAIHWTLFLSKDQSDDDAAAPFVKWIKRHRADANKHKQNGKKVFQYSQFNSISGLRSKSFLGKRFFLLLLVDDVVVVVAVQTSLHACSYLSANLI